MLYCDHLLHVSLTRLDSISKSMRRQIKIPKEEFREDVVKQNTIEATRDLRMALMMQKEFRLIKEQSYKLQNIAVTMLWNTLHMDDSSLDDIADAIDTVTESVIEEVHGSYSLSWKATSYNTNDQLYITGDEPATFMTDQKPSVYFNQQLKFPTARRAKLLDLYIRSGEEAPSLSRINQDNVDVYGVDVESLLVREKRPYYHRIISGPLKGARITNGAFDAVYLRTPITLEKEGSLTVKKLERDYLYRADSYLREGGVLGYVVPVYCLHKEVCSFIASHYEDIRIVTGNEEMTDETCHFRLVLIMGKKKPFLHSKVVDEKYYNILRDLSDPKNMKKIPREIEDSPYELPFEDTEILTFRGSILTEEECLQMMEASAATQNFIEDQRPHDISDQQHPLLPFTTGQLGLVLTSGVLDGVVDEGDGHYHVVRGRIRKHRSSPEETERVTARGNTIVESKVMVSNVIELNVITPDGRFKKLVG